MDNKNNIISKVIIIICLIAAFTGGYFFSLKSAGHSAAAPSAAAPQAQSEAEVSVVSLKKQPIETFYELPARVHATNFSAVRPQVDGVILKRTFVEGEFVEKGTQLYQIDPTVYAINYQTASSTLTKAQANLKTLEAKWARYQNLRDLEAISKQEYDDLQSLLTQARADVASGIAEVKRAKTSLDYTKVLAPVAGYVGKSNVLEGNLVTMNQEQVLTTITESSAVYIDMVEVSKKIANIQDQLGIPVGVIVEGAELPELGTLKVIENFADETNDSVRLRAEFENEDHKLISGMFVKAKLHLKPYDAILVPQRTATRTPDGSLMIFVVEKDNIVKSRKINTKEAIADNWVVLDGLNEGDVVVYEGIQKIADGAKVKPILMTK